MDFWVRNGWLLFMKKCWVFPDPSAVFWADWQCWSPSTLPLLLKVCWKWLWWVDVVLALYTSLFCFWVWEAAAWWIVFMIIAVLDFSIFILRFSLLCLRLLLGNLPDPSLAWMRMNGLKLSESIFSHLSGDGWWAYASLSCWDPEFFVSSHLGFISAVPSSVTDNWVIAIQLLLLLIWENWCFLEILQWWCRAVNVLDTVVVYDMMGLYFGASVDGRLDRYRCLYSIDLWLYFLISYSVVMDMYIVHNCTYCSYGLMEFFTFI